MSRIDLQNVHIEFPVYNVSSRSLKKSFMRMATGGSVAADANDKLVVNALKEVSLTIDHGDRVGLIGHNGAGKSSFLRLLAGIYEPTHGHIKIDGHVSPMLDFTLGMENEFTGYENIMLRGTFLGQTRQTINKRMDEISELSGLGDYLAMPVRTYSSGMLLRLAFSISVTIDPDILIVDEIFSAGDESFMKAAKAKMENLLHQSNIVVMANHSNELIKTFCNKAILFDNGHVKFFGDVDEALRLYATRQ